MPKLTEIEGVGKVYAKKLLTVGIKSTNSLLQKGATRNGRKEIAKSAGVSDKLVLEWVNRVDLFRIKGVGEEYSDLLENSGVDSVPELAQRNATNLFQKMVATDKKKKLVRKLPTETQVADWIKQAKKLPRIVKH